MALGVGSRTLIGRDEECARVDELLKLAHEGRSGTLLLVGEPGIGKTALLGYAVELATGLTVLTTRGIESESELPYSGLSELLRPLLHAVDSLPERQARALESALAIGPATNADPFAVAAATLSLLAMAAVDHGVVVIVDDLPWVDEASSSAILFALRRLGAEPTVGLLAARADGTTDFAALGLPVLYLEGLDRAASSALVATHATAPVSAQIADRLFEGTGGNPLALVELSRGLGPDQLSGMEPLDEAPLPVGQRLELAYMRTVARLPADTRAALLVAASCDVAVTDLVDRTLRSLGLRLDVLDEAERGELVSVTERRITFRHPLIRSAVYQASDPSRRREVHRAIGAALTDPGDAARRAWHWAAAATGPDEEVALALDAAGRAASGRSGFAAAARAFERAADLSAEPEHAATRLVEAARDWRVANRTDRAIEQLGRAAGLTADVLLRARIHQERGRIDTWRGPALRAHADLRAEAERVVELAPERAVAMLCDAALAAITGGRIDLAVETARRAYERATAVGGRLELRAALELGKASILAGDAKTGYPLILRCTQVLADDEEDFDASADVVLAAPALLTVEAYDVADRILGRFIALERDAHALGLLSYSLGAMAELQERTGRWVESYANGSEASLLAREAGQEGQLSYNLARLARVEAARGLEADCRDHVSEALDLARRTDFGSTFPFAESALGLLELGLGRYQEAVEHLEATGDAWTRAGFRDPGRLAWEADLVEAYLRSGHEALARELLGRMEQDAERFVRPPGPTMGRCALASAAVARYRGVLAAGNAMDARFAEAFEWHGRTTTPFERARTALCYGERLRRVGRRVEARVQLRAALDTFDRLDATPWTSRAHNELAATGERIAPIHPRPTRQLTPQELQVALEVSRGATNREAAASLFLTPKTIEFHLAKIYRKLDLRSRAELAGWAARHLSPAESPAAPETFHGWEPRGDTNAGGA